MAETSLSDQMEAIYHAFHKQFPYDEDSISNSFVDEIFPDHVIVRRGEKYYKVGYTVGDMILFDDLANWQEVKEVTTYEPVKNAIKAVAQNAKEMIVENHIVLFGGRDLTGEVHGKNSDGSSGEYFAPDTLLESDYTKSGVLHVDFEHGQDPDEIGNNPDAILGYVDWKTARADDSGVIVRRVLNRQHRYMKWLEPLIKAGAVGNSSQSVKGAGRKTADGKIVNWPLERDTLTFTPMEPRMLSGNVLTAVKALAEEIPYYKSVLLPDSAPLAKSDVKTVAITHNVINQNGVKKMTEPITINGKSVDEHVADLVSNALKAKFEADDKAAAEAKALQAKIDEARAEGAKAAVEDLQKQGLLRRKHGYHSTEPTDDDNDGVHAFRAWLDRGDINGGLISPDDSYHKISDSKAAWNVTTGSTGAYLVPDPLYNRIVGKRDLASFIRQAPVQKFTTEAEHLLVPVENTKHTAFVKTAEAGTYDENEGTVNQVDLIQFKYTKMSKFSEEFMQYQGMANWEEWFSGVLARSTATLENTAYTTGAGGADIQGVVTGATDSGITLATVDVILPSEMTALIGTLPAGYNVSNECGFLMANATKWYLKGLTGYNFQYAPTPQGGGGTPQDFHGYPAFVSDDMAPYTTESAKPVLFGNWQYYGLLEKPGIVIQRNPYLYMATGQLAIFASIYRGGAVLQAEAFRYINSHA